MADDEGASGNVGLTVEMSMMLQAPRMKMLLCCEVEMSSYTEEADCKYEHMVSPALLPVDLVQVGHQLLLLALIEKIFLRANNQAEFEVHLKLTARLTV